MIRPNLDRDVLILLSRRNNLKSALRLVLHFFFIFITGYLGYYLIENNQYAIALPIIMLYGFAFSFLGYAGLGHELQHNSVFTWKWLNESLFVFVSFLTWNNPVYFRASHRNHHRHTLQSGVDFEVSPESAPLLLHWWRYIFLDVEAMQRTFSIFRANAIGNVPGPFGERNFSKASPQTKTIKYTARYFSGAHLLIAGLGVAAFGWHFLLLFTFAPFICTWPNRVLAKLQHVGMKKNQDDYRLNSRTILLPAWLGFFYWNMNYHIEHHMFPNVPYQNLSILRQNIIDCMPEAPGTLGEFYSLLANRDVS